MLRQVISLSEQLVEQISKRKVQPGDIVRSPIFLSLIEFLKNDSSKFIEFEDGKIKKILENKHPAHLPLHRSGNLNIGIYLFPVGSGLPLHDHPELTVITKVLRGSLDYLSVDLKNESKQKKFPHSFFEHFKDGYNIRKHIQFQKSLYNFSARVAESRKLLNNEVVYLNPDRGNLHSFQATEEVAAILDIIFPDYDYEDRFCNFYKIISESKNSNSIELKYESPMPPYECQTLEEDSVNLKN